MLLDTNVLSELNRALPDPNVLAWAGAVDERELYVSVVSIAEMRYGVQLLEFGRRRAGLESALPNVIERFADRTLPVDVSVADIWGRSITVARRSGQPVQAMDGLIGATALVHGMTVVTRNVHHFTALRAAVTDPWRSD